MTIGKSTDQGIESEEAIDENTPLIRNSDDTASSSKSIQRPVDEPAPRKLGWLKDFSEEAKVLFGVMTASIIALLLLYLVVPSDDQDQCVRPGYKTFETPVISFNTTEFAIFLIPSAASGGIIKVSQLTTNDTGTVYAHINTSPGDVADSIGYSVNIDKSRTSMTLSLPDLYDSKACVYVEVEIQVPAHTTILGVLGGRNVEIVVDTALNVDSVTMDSSKAPIRLLGGWQGRTLMLTTSNADLDFGGNHSLHATSSIFLSSANSLIQLDDSSSGSIKAYAYGGRIKMRNTTATSWIEPITAYGSVSLRHTRASNITIQTKQKGAINLDHVTVDRTLVAKTEHGAIRAQLDGSHSINAKFETSDGNVNITMPDHFTGHFAVYTAWDATNVTIIGNNSIVMDTDLPGKKAGHTKKHGEGTVLLRTWHSPQVNLAF